ncbi:hypothetical protein Athai_58350 [Actinocatenispora thailandica]|uniref:Uncharacterized protein n=1 Tax=Actinocatenispora thailandica TaxID=227318 RepID=A0A7R7HZG6_9ACTN|nr:hypothetical protein [Actinocatenispora thailandica]BCJ38332.1 hypothetical protein Athai_58350 [Actinocatenispora thailandica]
MDRTMTQNTHSTRQSAASHVVDHATRPVGAEPIADQEPARRRSGRRLLLLAGTGLFLVGAAWTVATVRTGLAATSRQRNRRNRRRFRRH